MQFSTIEHKVDELFPRPVKVRLQVAKKSAVGIEKMQAAVQALENNSKAKRGYGYSIEYKRQTSRAWQTQNLPTKIYFESLADDLRFIEAEHEYKRFDDVCL